MYQILPLLSKVLPQSQNCDILQGNSWNAFEFKGSAPLAVTEHLVVHAPEYDPYRTSGQRIYHRWIFRCEKKSLDAADAVICVSQDTRKKLTAAFGYSDSKVIYNGVDTSLFKPHAVERRIWGLPEKKILLLFVGNLSRRKGADLLPAIMRSLGDDFLLLTTSGIREHSQNNIPHSRDLGHLNISQLINAYNLCDVFFLPSRLEGLSLSTLEAMACGKPVVAFNCSSFPELITDGKGGFLSEKENINGIIEKIRYLANEPELIKKMGSFNRERVENNFSIEKMTRNYLALYKSVL
jgi:glycosyltransferase involved in cell wall biosynthesis